jgi:hypothetical protein
MTIRDLLLLAKLVRVRALRPGIETARASEEALGKDWLRPEEDIAWRGL